MRKLLILIFITITNICSAQQVDATMVKLSVSPAVDQKKQVTKEIITTLRKFLQTKNNSLVSNDYWLISDFEKHKYPFLDIFEIEKGKKGSDFYQPTLMEIVSTDNQNQWIVKLAFVGYNNENQENQIRAIYNIVANNINDKIVFSRYQDFVLANWKQIERDEVYYYISPLKKVNEHEIAHQQKDIQKLCDFFNTKPIPLTYISCINPKELFEVKGFDYNPMMYVSKVGGLAEYGNIILSGNNSEIYTHEIIHIYTLNLFPNKHPFFDEGLATYLSGSGTFDYSWHKEKFKRFIQKNPDFKIENYMDDLYERLYFEEETSIPYLIAAVVCERTIRLYGKEKYFEILNSQDNLWTSLEKVGLTKENINKEVRQELGWD